MQALPPKHLARRGRRLGMARSPEYVFEALTALAVILVAATVFANLPNRSGPDAGSRGQEPDQGGGGTAATAASRAGETSRPPGAATFGNLVANWSFEKDLSGWQVVGAAGVSQAPVGRTSGSCASVRASGPQPARVGLRLPAVVADAPKGSWYVASAWVRSTVPGQAVTIRLVGAGDGAQASRADAQTLPGVAWRRMFVGHTVAAAGMDLDLEVTADGLPAGDALLVDEVVVRQG
jgi:hypothetical protein